MTGTPYVLRFLVILDDTAKMSANRNECSELPVATTDYDPRFTSKAKNLPTIIWEIVFPPKIHRGDEKLLFRGRGKVAEERVEERTYNPSATKSKKKVQESPSPGRSRRTGGGVHRENVGFGKIGLL